MSQKRVEVSFVGQARLWVEGEHRDLRLVKAISRCCKFIVDDPLSGIQIKKSLIPRQYQELYQTRNLWKMNLPGGWRMLYTLKQEDESCIGCYVVEIMDHKDYELRFGYG